MQSNEVDIKGITYSIGRLNTFQQWDLARKLAPILTALMPAFAMASSARPEGENSEANILGTVSSALQPLAIALSQMTRLDSNFVLNLCLDAVRRRDPQQGTYMPVRVPGPLEEPGLLRFENEMDFTIMLRLAWEVIQQNIGPFLREGLEASAAMPNGQTQNFSGLTMDSIGSSGPG